MSHAEALEALNITHALLDGETVAYSARYYTHYPMAGIVKDPKFIWATWDKFKFHIVSQMKEDEKIN